MDSQSKLVDASAVGQLRETYRAEMDCQIVHDPIHRRPGWTLTYLLESGGVAAGFATVAIGGPWKEKATILEFFLTRQYRTNSFHLFEALLEISEARQMEIQSNNHLLRAMLFTYARAIVAEKVVFRDEQTTSWQIPGAVMRCKTPHQEVQTALDQRRGGTEWELEFEGQPAAKGGVLFHYNRPYGDVYMEVAKQFCRRGLGTFMVQELKRIAYGVGAVPAARCNPDNVASRSTLQKAGFVPFAEILVGTIPRA